MGRCSSAKLHTQTTQATYTTHTSYTYKLHKLHKLHTQTTYTSYTSYAAQVRALVGDFAKLAARTAAELAQAAERQRTVDAAQELALQASFCCCRLLL